MKVHIDSRLKLKLNCSFSVEGDEGPEVLAALERGVAAFKDVFRADVTNSMSLGQGALQREVAEVLDIEWGEMVVLTS